MCQMHLVDEVHGDDGVRYMASDDVPSFLRLLRAPYTMGLRERAKWLAEAFGHKTGAEIEDLADHLVDRWTMEFGLHDGGRDEGATP